ncbi:MAG TPA: DNA primase [Candidatus Thermoplasmatota archaeon]|nr:DNA primase [Candidatus Thermoplasmatota archaeon]
MDEPSPFRELLRALEDLAHASEGATILVEGRRDIEALAALGCRGNLVPINQGEPLFKVCEAVAELGQPVIVLTDWDRRGTILHGQVTAALQACGVPVDTAFRDRIRNLVEGDLKDVEALGRYVARGLERFRQVSLEDHVASVLDLRGVAEPF